MCFCSGQCQELVTALVTDIELVSMHQCHWAMERHARHRNDQDDALESDARNGTRCWDFCFFVSAQATWKFLHWTQFFWCTWDAAKLLTLGGAFRGTRKWALLEWKIQKSFFFFLRQPGKQQPEVFLSFGVGPFTADTHSHFVTN